MRSNNFTITGRIIDHHTKLGIPGLRIEAWDKDLFFDDLVGSAETDEEGFFEIRFNEEHFRELIERRPDLYFKLYSADEAISGEAFELTVTPPSGEPLTGSGDSVFWKLAPGETNVSISLALPVASQLFKVKGTILEPDGTPVAGRTVKAFDKNIRTETLLGEATTNKVGRYEIAYRAETFLQSGKKQPDLIVRAFDQEGKEIAHTKEPIYNARQIEEVNLVVGNVEYKGPPEYERLLDMLSPLLQDLELSELTDDDVEFLAGKTGISSEQIIYLVLAARYSKKTDLPSEIFYGLFRQNFPTSLPALIAQDTDILMAALAASVTDNIVSETIPPEQVLQRFQELVVDHAFEPLEPLPNGKTTIGELIGSVQITPQQQREFLNRYVCRQGTIEEFWHELEQSDLQASVQELQYTMQLGVLTGNHLSLVQHIKQLESVSSLEDLAGLGFDEWKGMVDMLGHPADVPGANAEEQANNYAQTIVRMLEDALPTAVISHRVADDIEFPGNNEDLVGFFANSPDFEFGNTQIDAYLQHNKSALIGVEDEDGLIQQLKSMDRLFRVSPRFERYEAIKVLMQNGFNSAQSIAKLGQRNFSARYAENLGNYHKAKAVYTNAVQMTAMTLNLQARYSRAFNQPGMYALPDIAKKMQEGIPDWESLFGSFQLCDCEHCKSVYSPSAYLVDLLAFLRNHNLQKPILGGPYSEINSALGVLSDRRHDIEHINLSCENTDTPVPYVDLVNEVLESAVSYSPAYYQTTGTADELGANPEYLNTDAYDRLAETIYPWSLPFDLWTEEARTYLNHLGISRYNLLETFQKNGENPTPNNLALASEYLGLTTKEQEIITDSSPSEPWLYWGLNEEETIPDPTDPDQTITVKWFELLCSVPVFLEKSGLAYKEQDELLNTRFINPGRFTELYDPEADICVEFPDEFCNIDEATIANLNSETLNKIHRFVRMLRKIDWTAKELDLTLDVLIAPHFDSTEIDEPFLLKLWHLHRLHSALKVPVVNLLSFWSVINTDSYKGQITSLYDQLFLNKAVLNPEDEIFDLNAQRNELENPNEQISDHAEGIQAALGISGADFSLLLGFEWLFNHSWTAEAQTSLNDGVLPEDWLQKFEDHEIQLSENRDVSVVEEDRKWLLIDNELKFTIRKDEKQNKFHIFAHRESEVPDELNLANLSHLYRIVILSRALKLSIGEFLSVKKLIGINPFLDPYDPRNLKETIRFTEKVEKVRNSGFKISELEYLLRHRYRESEGIAPLDDEIALVLGEIRDGLQKIAEETSIAPDPAGELTAANLAWLQWDDSHIQSVIDTLDNRRDFTVTLTALPDGSFQFPSELANRIYYDADNKKLHFSGMMSEDEIKTLLGLSGHKKYQKAIKDLFEDAKSFIGERMKAYQLPPFSAPLDNFPPEVIFPEQLKDRIYYDENSRELFFIGWMTEAEKDVLLLKEEYGNFNVAIESLFNAPQDYKPEKENRFLSEKEILELAEASNIKGRFEIVLKHLLPYIRNVQNTNFVVQKIANTFKLEAKVAEKILTHYVVLPADYVSGKKAIEILLSPDFAESNPNIDLTPSAFPEQFNAYILLHKIALIISKLRITVDDTPLLFQRNPDVWGDRGWADLNFLPLTTLADPSGLFRSAEKLFDLFKFRDILLPGEPTLFEILNMAFNPVDDSLEMLLSALSERTGWNHEDLQQLLDWFGFDLVDFEHMATLVKLMPCFITLKRLGVSAEKVCDWISVPEDPNNAMDKAYQTARSIKQAAKAKYDNERWLEVAKPLRDALREKQRSALVSYLIAHYAFRDKTFEDSNDLYAHFLIDPEMDPCMMTSRLKLATSTVQLFVQRCLMNLEEWKIPNATIAQEWSSQWQWMKNYRVWEANRKVFLYPENWIEPELRDDKSPFFKDLENELLQNEVTSDHVEKVFLNYLEKLDAVARLEICGMYHEVEKEAPGGIGKNAIDTLHVFGRTRGIPHIYYYCRRIATGGKTMYWTPWEKVDLDIEGDHLIPVVWNRRLYLFWPIFTGKANEKQKLPEPGQKGKKPEKYWEIQMAWSEYKNGKWSAKKISSESIESNQKPENFLFRISIDSQNHLTIRLIDTVAESKLSQLFYLNGDLTQYIEDLNECQLSQELRAEFASNGYSLPSQAVVTVYQASRAWLILFGDYKYIIIAAPNGWLDMIVFAHVSEAFKFDGCSPVPIKKKVIQSVLNTLTNTEWYQMYLREKEDSEGFYLPTPQDALTFGKTPGIFFLLPPSDGKQPFFYQDNAGIFFVTSRSTGISDPQNPPDIDHPDSGDLPEWYNPNKVQPEQVESFLPDYYEFIPQYEHWEEMLSPTIEIDPPIIETTFPAGTYNEEVVEQTPDYGFYGASAGAEARRLTRSETSSHMTENSSTAMAHASLATAVSERTYLFETFYHPYVCEFVKYLNRDGIDGLLQRPVQLLNSLLFTFAFEGGLEALIVSGVLEEQFEKNGYPLSENVEISIKEKKVIIKDRGVIYSAIKSGSRVSVYKDLFEDTYLPTDVVDKPYPYEDVDFSPEGAYSLYNWEIFFHTPLMVADRLSSNQRFADAQKWFHYIFDPTDTSTHDVPQKYWKLRPFFEVAGEEAPETLEDLLTKEKDELEKQVKEWRDNPFKPHLIARMRLVAYQKTVVMKYIDNLIAWGDQLFRRDSIESINEATQLYILAAEILGKRPEEISPHTEPPVMTFNDLKDEGLDAFSNAMVDAENYLPSPKSAISMTRAGDMQMFGPSFYLCCPAAREGEEDKDVLYFCIPKNQKLLSYWDTVADRLFKIRHCMTIEGVVRRLPLFEPPIEPGLLVRAAAAGVDIGSALNDLNAPLPHYRFQYMLQKAVDLCADVRSLGASLLSALEKKDAEELALMRSGHEVTLLKAVRQIKKQQIDDAKKSLEGLEKSKEVTEARFRYYSSREYMNSNEQLYLDKLEQAHDWQMHAQRLEVAAATAHLLPTLDIGIAGYAASPLSKIGVGGPNLGSALQATAGVMRALASIENHEATRSSIRGGYDRRLDDWIFQAELASKELEQIDKQILAAEIRLAIAEKDLINHDLQIDNAEEANSFMKDKFTNQELYNWMVSQISTIYFQSYQMAYDLAKRAEKTFRYELGDYDTTFIKFGYWDNLKKGLLSGEQLHYDLKRMETAYLDKNKREFELTTHISLAMIDPFALVRLKETGQCFLNLPEALFDLDYAGHYMRRIKSVSLTIPCVTGPFTAVNCTLTLLNNSVRINSTAEEDYPRNENDLRFRDNIGAIQSIATSSGQNDSGLFELNFRDERYLPFEGAGAISSWRLELPTKFEKFDYSTISDVVIHLKYTARDGGHKLKTIVEDGLQVQLNELLLSAGKTGLFKGFNIRHEFPNEWHNLKQNNSASFTLTKQHLPQFVQEHVPSIDSVTWYARVKDNPVSFEMSLNGNKTKFILTKEPSLNNLCVGTSVPIALDSDFTLSAENADDLEELVLLIKYTLDS